MKNRILIVGQGPSKDGDPTNPLQGRIGLLLAQLLQITPEEYLQDYDRVNLNKTWTGKIGMGKGDAYDAEEGRASAVWILSSRRTRFILLGRHVALSFGILWRKTLDVVERDGKRFLLVPHPSGISLWWNDPNNVEAAGEALRRFADEEKERWRQIQAGNAQPKLSKAEDLRRSDGKVAA